MSSVNSYHLCLPVQIKSLWEKKTILRLAPCAPSMEILPCPLLAKRWIAGFPCDFVEEKKQAQRWMSKRSGIVMGNPTKNTTIYNVSSDSCFFSVFWVCLVHGLLAASCDLIWIGVENLLHCMQWKTYPLYPSRLFFVPKSIRMFPDCSPFFSQCKENHIFRRIFPHIFQITKSFLSFLSSHSLKNHPIILN